MNIKDFAQYVADSVQELAETNDTDINSELIRYYLDCMEECGEVSAPEICIFSEEDPNCPLMITMMRPSLLTCSYLFMQPL